MMNIPIEDHMRRKELYDQGLNDRQIGEREEGTKVTDDLKQKVTDAIGRLKTFQKPEGYHLAFSGGKDSCVIKALADMAGVKYHAVYRVTGIDPPELFQFIKEHHPDVELEFPRYDDGKRVTMWNLITRKKMPPTRLMRYCCQYLKESSGDGKMTVTGVRWDESTNRKQNQGVVTVMSGGKKLAKDLNFDENPNFQQTIRGGWYL